MSEITWTPYEGMDEIYKEQRLRRQKGAAARALPTVLASEGYDIAPLFDPVPVSNEDRSKLMGDTADPLKPGEKRVGGQQTIEDQYTQQQLGDQQAMMDATRLKQPGFQAQPPAGMPSNADQMNDMIGSGPGDFLRGLIEGKPGERVSMKQLEENHPDLAKFGQGDPTGLSSTLKDVGVALATDPYTYTPGVGFVPMKGGPVTDKVIAGFNRLLTEEKGATDLFGPGNVFQSQLSRIIQEKVKGPTSYDQIAGMLKNNTAMQDEMKWTGLDEYLKGGKRDANDIQRFLSENAVQVQEIQKTQLMRTTDSIYAPREEHTQYDRYTLPGGKNYREILLTLPSNRPKLADFGSDRAGYDAAVREADARAAGPRGWADTNNPRKAAGDVDYRDPHWDEPNVVSHARTTDRTLPDGRKVLYAENIQSGWAKAIGERGVGVSDTEYNAMREAHDRMVEEYQVVYRKREDLIDQLGALVQDPRIPKGNIVTARPDTSETGTMVALGGYNNVIVQHHAPSQRSVITHLGRVRMPEEGNALFEEYRTLDKQIQDIRLGKNELEARMAATSNAPPDMPFKSSWYELTLKRLLRMAAEEGYDGLAWAEGASVHKTDYMPLEPAQGLYDRTFPRYMKKYVEKWGGTVERGDFGTWPIRDSQGGMEMRQPDVPNAHIVPITPTMREGVMAGQPLFGNALSAVKDFAKGLPKAQVKDIAESVSKLPDTPNWVRENLLSGESGRLHQGLAYMLGRMIAGGTLGSNMGDTQDDRLRNALVGAGIGAFASPALVSKLRRAMRGTQPSAARVEGATEATRPDLEYLDAGGQRIGIDFTKMQANPASVDQLVSELSGLYRDAAHQTGGPRYGLTPAPIPHALTARLAVQLGVTEEEMLNRLPGTALRPEELHAYADLHDLAWQRLRRLFAQWETAGNGDPALKEELKHQISMHYFLGSQMLGGGQIAGRSLNILGKPDVQAQMARARSFVGSVESVSGDINMTEMAAIFRSIDQGTWASATRAAQKASGWDMLAEMVYANTLSNPITWSTNLFSGIAVNPLLTITTRSLAESKGAFKRAAGGSSGVAPGETAAAMHGYLSGNLKMIAAIRDAWDDSLNTAQPGRLVGQPDNWPGRWRAVVNMFDKVQNLEPVGYSVAESTSAKPPALTGENFSALMKRHKLTAPYAIDPNGVIATGIDAFGVLARTLSKTPLDLGDRWAYAVNMEMASESLAVRKAFERGGNAAEIEALQRQYLAELPADIREEAERFAQHEIFKTPIEGFTGEVVKGLGHPAMRLFIEFVRTPWRIMTYTAEGLPLASRTVTYFQEEIAAGGARAELARAKVQVGSVFTSILFAAAFSDKITGYGPQNPEQRGVWLMDHQPFSVNVGTTEKPHWLSFARLEPFASWAGLAADQAKAMQHTYEASPGEWEHTIPAWTKDIVYGTPMNFAKQLTNKTFTKDAFEAMSLLVPRNWEGEGTFEKRLERYVENRARLLVPFGSALSAIESRQDPAVAEQRSAMDVLGARLPDPMASWFGHTKVPLLDLFGKVVAHEDPYGLDQISFVAQKHAQKDPVVDAMNRNEVKPPRFPDYVGNVKTTAQELHDLKKLRAEGPFGMEPLHKALESVIARQDFIEGNVGAQGYQNLALSKMIERYHDAAIKAYSLQHPKFGKLARTVTQAEQRGFIPKGSIKPDDFKIE